MRIDVKIVIAMFMVWYIAIILALPRPSLAATEGRSCIGEPTEDIISFGGVITCTIDSIGDTDTFSFAGHPGETVTVQAARQRGGTTPCVELFGPTGTLIDQACGGGGARVDTTLEQEGTYTILVTESFNDATMPYTLALERVAPPAPSALPICPGCSLNNEINPVGDLDLFFFQGGAGDTVLVQAARQRGGTTPCVELFGPTGTLIDQACGGGGARVDTTLEQEGTYTILVTESFNDATMPYTLSYQCVGSCPAPPIPAVSGCILVKSSPLSGGTVLLRQPEEVDQTTTTDANGCYAFANAAAGKGFEVLIQGSSVASFAGTYVGSYSGDDSGTFTMTVDTEGKVTGSGVSTVNGFAVDLDGTVSSTGEMIGTTTAGATYAGTITLDGTMSGTWESGSESGTFEASRQ